MPDAQKVYLDAKGNPIAAGAKTYLDEQGNPIQPPPPPTHDVSTVGQGLFTPGLAAAGLYRDAGAAPPRSVVMDGLRHAALPQSGLDVLGLLMPTQVEGAINTGGRYLHAIQQGFQDRPPGASGLLKVPALAYQSLKENLPSEVDKAIEAFRGPKTPPPAPSSPVFRSATPDAFDRAAAADRAVSESGKIRPVGGGTVGPDGQVLRPIVPREPPGGPSGPSGSGGPRTFYQGPGAGPGASAATSPIEPVASHPLTAPRAATGAENVARDTGQTTQAVRDATGPVLGEAPGAASPILPRDPSQKIIAKLIDMGPKGANTVPEAERDAYVMRANGEKNRAQIKAYLDALRSVGYGGAAGVAARQALTSPMTSDGGGDQ